MHSDINHISKSDYVVMSFYFPSKDKKLDMIFGSSQWINSLFLVSGLVNKNHIQFKKKMNIFFRGGGYIYKANWVVTSYEFYNLFLIQG